MALLDNGRCQRKRARDRFDVAIAGGGLAGRSARARARQALPRKAFASRWSTPSRRKAAGDDARALALSAATRNLLSALDLWHELAPSAQAIEAIEITDSPLDAALRPHFLGFDAELKDGGATAHIVEHGALTRVLAAAVARTNAIALFAPDSVTDYAADAFKVVVTLGTGETIDAALLVAADGKRSRLARARRHQMRWLVLSANRHRRYRGACAPASWQGGAAFSSLRAVRHAAAARQPLLDRLDRREGARRSHHGCWTKRASSPSSPSVSAGASARFRWRVRANPFRSTCRSRAPSWPTGSR